MNQRQGVSSFRKTFFAGGGVSDFSETNPNLGKPQNSERSDWNESGRRRYPRRKQNPKMEPGEWQPWICLTLVDFKGV